MSHEKHEHKPHNRIVRIGMWSCIAVGLFWVGGITFQQIQAVVPWLMAAAALILVLGLLIQYRKPKVVEAPAE